MSQDNSAAIGGFLSIGFAKNFTPSKLSPAEDKAIAALLANVKGNVQSAGKPRKYVLGLALDFVMLAQCLSNVDAQAKQSRSLTEDALFQRYTLVTKRGDTTANTLTLEYRGSSIGIRKLEERVIELFANLNRSGYPSAYVYNTGQWQKYKDLLLQAFNLSESARFHACLALVDYGMHVLPAQGFFGRPSPRVRLLELLIEEYPRSAAGENGGLVLQAIAHGFIKADRPHLSIIADKVRTGSARQKRFGDIDCYAGLDLELSVEVKDVAMTAENYADELQAFANNVAANGVLGLVVAQSFTDAVVEKLRESGVGTLSLGQLLSTVRLWDWTKQEIALQGLLHHIAHIEQNVGATQRVLRFIKEGDPSHDSLIYLNEGDTGDASADDMLRELTEK